MKYKVGDILKYKDNFDISRLAGKEVKVVEKTGGGRVDVILLETGEVRHSNIKFLEKSMNRNGANI